MATILDGENQIPFLRGMLTHYLIEHEFSFQEAYQVADSIRAALQKKQELQGKDMIELVRTHVHKLFGDRPIGDGVFWEPMSRQLLVEDGRRTSDRRGFWRRADIPRYGRLAGLRNGQPGSKRYLEEH